VLSLCVVCRLSGEQLRAMVRHRAPAGARRRSISRRGKARPRTATACCRRKEPTPASAGTACIEESEDVTAALRQGAVDAIMGTGSSGPTRIFQGRLRPQSSPGIGRGGVVGRGAGSRPPAQQPSPDRLLTPHAGTRDNAGTADSDGSGGDAMPSIGVSVSGVAQSPLRVPCTPARRGRASGPQQNNFFTEGNQQVSKHAADCAARGTGAADRAAPPLGGSDAPPAPSGAPQRPSTSGGRLADSRHIRSGLATQMLQVMARWR
jgi:hypothetical protein